MEIDKGKEVLSIKPKRVRNIASARRLLASVIFELQKGNVSDSKAKTIAYLLIKYSELFKIEKLDELNERITKLEEERNAKFN